VLPPAPASLPPLLMSPLRPPLRLLLLVLPCAWQEKARSPDSAAAAAGHVLALPAYSAQMGGCGQSAAAQH
jgi:hypothetical protein